MNEFEQMQAVRPPIEGESENIAAARSKLVTALRVESQTVRPRPTRSAWLVAAGVAAAAAVTAGVLIIGNLTPPERGLEAVPAPVPSPSIQPSASPEPSAQPPLTPELAFRAAGAAASVFDGLAVGPGQYLRIHTESEQMMYHRPDAEPGQFQTDRSNATDAWLDVVFWDTYVPADQSDDWYVVGGDLVVTQIFGSAAEELAQRHAEEIGGASEPYFLEHGVAPPWGTSGEFTMEAFWRDMPRDPSQLISWIRDNQGPVSGDQDYKVGWVLVELLAHNVGPADARSALYEALSLLGGAEVIAEKGDTVTIRFSAADQALSGAAATIQRTIKIDMGSGLVLEKSVTLETDSSLVPNQLPDERYTYTLSVVDALP